MKIIILQGIPGSGKSTWARSYLKEHGSRDTVIVNRDSIRAMLGDYWVPERESLVTKIETNMIRLALKHNYDVIIDATNLNEKTLKKWKFLAELFGADIEYKKFLINPHKAVIRDLIRKVRGERYTGAKVIYDFYERYKDKLKDET